MTGIHPLVVSAPFGNYVGASGATSTLGTFTLHQRRGRLLRILKTVRYSVSTKAWVNKIGLRNPGIGWLESKVQTGKDISPSILSIHGFNDAEWYELIDRAGNLKPLAIELNLSCPNVGEISWPAELFERAVRTGVPVIAKVPPIRFQGMVEAAVSGGVRSFHCCNTLPVPQGGLSGKPLKPVSLECVRWVRQLNSHSNSTNLFIIGGGGITTPTDIDEYADAGANVFAIGTKTMNPKLFLGSGLLQPLIAHAAKRAQLPVASDNGQ